MNLVYFTPVKTNIMGRGGGATKTRGGGGEELSFTPTKEKGVCVGGGGGRGLRGLAEKKKSHPSHSTFSIIGLDHLQIHDIDESRRMTDHSWVPLPTLRQRTLTSILPDPA